VAATLDLPLAMDGATQPPPEARRQGAIPELDGLRGIAILLVLLRHGARPYWEGTGSLYPIGAWDAGIPLVNGWMGVDLFFVLSGFLISHHIMRRSAGPVARVEWREYCSRRLLRIAPAYYAVLLLVALVPLPFYPIDREGIGLRLAYHLLFLQDYLPSDFVVAFWSLGVEVKFYLAAPLLLLALTRLTRPLARYRALVLLLPRCCSGSERLSSDGCSRPIPTSIASIASTRRSCRACSPSAWGRYCSGRAWAVDPGSCCACHSWPSSRASPTACTWCT
jgi:hypothetical protein